MITAFALLSGCIELPLDSTDTPTPSSTLSTAPPTDRAAIEIHRGSESWQLQTNSTAVLNSIQGHSLIGLTAVGVNQAFLTFLVSNSGPIEEGDVFELGRWGDLHTEQTALAVGVFANNTIEAWSTETHGDRAVGSITIERLDFDNLLASFSFEGDLFRQTDEGPSTETQHISGTVLNIDFEYNTDGL